MSYPQRRTKYGNRRMVVDGRSFDSKAEAAEYMRLAAVERAGLIRNLECQVRFRMPVNGVEVCSWIADFTYIDTHSGEFHTVDVKGFKTAAYKLKSKLFRACYGWPIEEIQA